MVSVAGFNSFASLMWPGRLFLFDATSGQLLHTEWLVPQRQIEYRKSVREIEANGLAELRRISAKAVAETIRRDVSEILRAPLKVRTLKDQHPRAPSATPGMAAEAESGTQPTPKVLDAPQQHVASSVPEVDGEQSVREGEDPGPGREAEVTQDTTTTPEP
jgi:hypothetical protein